MTKTLRRTLVVGATSGIGWALAKDRAARGESVVLTSRDPGRAAAAALNMGPEHRGIHLDLTRPQTIAERLGVIAEVDHLALVGSVRDENTLAGYDVEAGIRALTAKMAGYAAVISAMLPKFSADASIVVLGGSARKAPYSGSTSTGLVNGAVSSMVATFAVELSPVRINALHPGAVADSPRLAAAPPAYLETLRNRTASRRLVQMKDVVHAAAFLFENRGINGQNLEIDGGFPTP